MCSVPLASEKTPYVNPDGPAPEGSVNDGYALTRPLEVRPVGGLGIHLVRTLMDGLGYERRGNTNLLTMTKKRGGVGHGD